MRLTTFLVAAGLAMGSLGVGIAAAALTHTVGQTDKAFDTKKLTVAVGDTVLFVNNDDVKHNVMVKKLGINTGLQDPGGEASVTFDKAGKFKVRCGIHPKMKITVTVEG